GGRAGAGAWTTADADRGGSGERDHVGGERPAGGADRHPRGAAAADHRRATDRGGERPAACPSPAAAAGPAPGGRRRGTGAGGARLRPAVPSARPPGAFPAARLPWTGRPETG